MAEAALAAAATNTEVGANKTSTAATALTGGATGEAKTAEQTAAEVAQTKVDTDKKAADEQTAKAKADADAKAAVVPEKYDLKLPEGVIVDEPTMAEFHALLKSDKISNAQAQKYADLQIKTMGLLAQKMAEDHNTELLGWHQEIVDDKEIGGAKLDVTMAQARKMMAVAATIPGVDAKRLSADLARTGMTTHPDMVRMMHFLGQFVGEDNKFISGQGGGGGPKKSDADVLYPDHKP